MTAILFTTIFLRQERGPGDVQVSVLSDATILRIYGVLAVSFFFSLVNVSWWDQTLKVRLYIPSQLFYDLLLTSYLVYLTGVNDSIFLFLYLLNIVFASVVYQLNGALIVAGSSGIVYAFIYYANIDIDATNAIYNLAYNELLFLLTALLCGQLMDELKRQKIMLEVQQQNIARLELINDRLLNSIPVGIVTIDQEEYVQNVNRTALHLLGLSHAPEMRLKYHELLPGLRGIIEAWPRMTETQRLRFLFRHGEASPAQFSFNLVTLKRESGDAGIGISHIFVFEDVSMLVELERKLEFESKLAATGELAAAIAHEVRNPLASISGAIEMLSRNLKLDSDQDKKLFDIAVREINRLNNLITDFLEFAKPRDDRSVDFRLRETVAEVAEAIQKSNNSKFQFSLSIAEPLRVSANPERIKQVLFNLFLNSIEASGGTPVKVTIQAAELEQDRVSIDVIDNGPGITAEVAAKIFDPFFTTKAHGTGLGLATVARIIKAAKGEIHLVPIANGAQFRIILPAATVKEIAGTAS